MHADESGRIGCELTAHESRMEFLVEDVLKEKHAEGTVGSIQVCLAQDVDVAFVVEAVAD